MKRGCAARQQPQRGELERHQKSAKTTNENAGDRRLAQLAIRFLIRSSGRCATIAAVIGWGVQEAAPPPSAGKH
jgi:hypothetical protein